MKKYKMLRATYIIFIMLSIFQFGKIVVSAIVNSTINYTISSDSIETIKPFSMLLIGTDEDSVMEDGAARSDVLMVVTFNPLNARGNVELNVVSVPRDSIALDTCSDSYNKINSAFSTGYAQSGTQGGIDCTVASVENFLNIPIDYYFSTSFNGVVTMVDAIGGIEIDVEKQITVQDSRENKDAIILEPGLQTLTGEQALGYARERYGSSDYERNIRQQQVIAAILKKIMKDPNQYYSAFFEVFVRDVETNFDFDLLKQFTNSSVGIYNDFLSSLSGLGNVEVNLRTSPYEVEQEISSVFDQATGLDTSNVVPANLTTLYDAQNDIDSQTYMTQVLYSKNATNIPTTSYVQTNTEGDVTDVDFDQVGFEIAAYSMHSGEINNPAGWYGFIYPSSLYYTSNVLRTSLGLEVETPNFDYSMIQLFAGPGEEQIYYEDSLLYPQMTGVGEAVEQLAPMDTPIIGYDELGTPIYGYDEFGNPIYG